MKTQAKAILSSVCLFPHLAKPESFQTTYNCRWKEKEQKEYTKPMYFYAENLRLILTDVDKLNTVYVHLMFKAVIIQTTLFLEAPTSSPTEAFILINTVCLEILRIFPSAHFSWTTDLWNLNSVSGFAESVLMQIFHTQNINVTFFTHNCSYSRI